MVCNFQCKWLKLLVYFWFGLVVKIRDRKGGVWVRTSRFGNYEARFWLKDTVQHWFVINLVNAVASVLSNPSSLFNFIAEIINHLCQLCRDFLFRLESWPINVRFLCGRKLEFNIFERCAPLWYIIHSPSKALFRCFQLMCVNTFFCVVFAQSNWEKNLFKWTFICMCFYIYLSFEEIVINDDRIDKRRNLSWCFLEPPSLPRVRKSNGAKKLIN